MIPHIVRQQEQRVRGARQAFEAARDDLLALRLRQRMLMQHGRADLAAGLEPLAEEKEGEVRRLQLRLSDEEAALTAYREYAHRAGVRTLPTAGGDTATVTRTYNQPPGSP